MERKTFVSYFIAHPYIGLKYVVGRILYSSFFTFLTYSAIRFLK
ncbi:MAG: hypothetical protein ACD_75C01610G0001 [uncultured bacterium]|nr:MAG: hypothetical protein ACD_75C01610G0001 [uncultured bacterium]